MLDCMSFLFQGQGDFQQLHYAVQQAVDYLKAGSLVVENGRHVPLVARTNLGCKILQK